MQTVEMIIKWLEQYPKSCEVKFHTSDRSNLFFLSDYKDKGVVNIDIGEGGE